MHVGYVGMEKGFICECDMRLLSNVGLKADWSLDFIPMPNESSQLLCSSAPPTASLLPSSHSWGKLLNGGQQTTRKTQTEASEWFIFRDTVTLRDTLGIL